jgi:hypothetical protein
LALAHSGADQSSARFPQQSDQPSEAASVSQHNRTKVKP